MLSRSVMLGSRWDSLRRGVRGVGAAARWTWKFGTEPDFAKKRVSDWKALAVHTWEGLKTGSRLFSKNVSISKNLFQKRAKGHGLTLQENKLLIRTVTDAFKLVPFSFFVIVPFAELLLPVALWVWPNMLPSTFKELISDDSRRLRRLRAKKEMASFFEKVINEKNESEVIPGKAKELVELQQLLKIENKSEPFPSAKNLVKFARLFSEDFQLEKMPIDHLRTICRVLGLNPFGFRSQLILQLRHATTSLLTEDRHIRWEGIDSLNTEDLRDACKARGMLPEEGTTEGQMRKMMENWLELSSQKDMPITLLLWSRSYAVTEDTELLRLQPESDDSYSSQRVEKYKAKVEWMIKRLKELEELEETTFNPQLIEPPNQEVSTDEPSDKQSMQRKIEVLQNEVKVKKVIIDMQNDMLKQQIELIAKLRDIPSLQKVPRRQGKEMRAELQKMYDQFESELKQLEDAIRENEASDNK